MPHLHYINMDMLVFNQVQAFVTHIVIKINIDLWQVYFIFIQK